MNTKTSLAGLLSVVLISGCSSKATINDVISSEVVLNIQDFPYETFLDQQRITKVDYPYLSAGIQDPSKNSWRIDGSLTIKKNLEQWAKKADWNVVWLAPSDYPAYDGVISGEFLDAVGVLNENFKKVGVPLGIKPTTGNKLIRVVNVR